MPAVLTIKGFKGVKMPNNDYGDNAFAEQLFARGTFFCSNQCRHYCKQVAPTYVLSYGEARVLDTHVFIELCEESNISARGGQISI